MLAADPVTDIAVLIDSRPNARSDEARQDVDALERMFKRHFGADHVIRLEDPSFAIICDVFGGCIEDRHNPWPSLLEQVVKRKRSRLYVHYLGRGRMEGSRWTWDAKKGYRQGHHRRQLLLPRSRGPGPRALVAYDVGWLHKELERLEPRSSLVFLETSFADQPFPCTSHLPLLMARHFDRLRKVYKTLFADHFLPQANMAELGATLPVQMAHCDRYAEVAGGERRPLFTRFLLEGITHGAADKPPFGDQDQAIELGEIEAYIEDRISHTTRFQWGREQHVWRFGPAGRVIAVTDHACAAGLTTTVCRTFCADNPNDPTCETRFCLEPDNQGLPPCPPVEPSAADEATATVDEEPVPARPRHPLAGLVTWFAETFIPQRFIDETFIETLDADPPPPEVVACVWANDVAWQQSFRSTPDPDGRASAGNWVERFLVRLAKPIGWDLMVRPAAAFTVKRALADICSQRVEFPLVARMVSPGIRRDLMELIAPSRTRRDFKAEICACPLQGAEAVKAGADDRGEAYCPEKPFYVGLPRWVPAGMLLSDLMRERVGCAVPIDYPSLWKVPQPQPLRAAAPPPGVLALSCIDRRGGKPLAVSQIRWMQAALTFNNFDPGPVDGVLGRETRDAIRRWREAREPAPRAAPPPRDLPPLGSGIDHDIGEHLKRVDAADPGVAGIPCPGEYQAIVEAFGDQLGLGPAGP